MIRLCVLSLCIISIGASPFLKSSRKVAPFKNIGGRIINGKEAAEGQFPWQAAILVTYSSGINLCGGAIINKEWILTAGHCVQGALGFQIKVGSVSLMGESPNRLTFSTNDSILHENFDASDLTNDIAVIRLPEPLIFNDYIQPIALPSEELDTGTLVTVSGWGLTSDDGDGASPNLNYVTLVTISNDQCNDVYTNLGDGVVCATSNDDTVRSSCEGDSGGPLVTNASDNPVHVGVVSFGHGDGCESGQPAGFSRTYYYRNWINNKTGI